MSEAESQISNSSSTKRASKLKMKKDKKRKKGKEDAAKSEGENESVPSSKKPKTPPDPPLETVQPEVIIVASEETKSKDVSPPAPATKSVEQEKSKSPKSPRKESAPSLSEVKDDAPESKDDTPEAEPPKKKKKVTMTDLIVDTLIKECKPFNLKGLAQKTRSTDAVLSSLMPSLKKKNLVRVKEFTTAKSSKTLVWANQSHERAKVEKVDNSDFQKAASSDERLKAELSTLEKQISTMKNSLTNKEIDLQIASEEETIKKMVDRINKSKAAIAGQGKTSNKPSLGGKVKSAKDIERENCPRRTKIRINNMRAEWVKRKNKCMDFIDQLADAMEKKPKEVINVVGVESDEAVKVNLTDVVKYVVDRDIK